MAKMDITVTDMGARQLSLQLDETTLLSILWQHIALEVKDLDNLSYLPSSLIQLWDETESVVH